MDLGKLNDESILLVEFVKNDKGEWVPWSIQTKDHGVNNYDIEYSKAYEQFYYSCSGAGGDLAVAQPKPFYVQENFVGECLGFDQYKEMRLLDFPFSQEEWNNWLENLVEFATVYCSECKDHLPADSDYPCDHIWWCDDCEWWSLPDERCEHRDRESDK